MKREEGENRRAGSKQERKGGREKWKERKGK